MIMQPRGIRNNNPGNLRVSEANHWQGRADWHERTPEQRLEREYEVYIAPEWGVRALAITLVSYYDRHGLTNLRGLIGRWAPQAENDTASIYALLCFGWYYLAIPTTRKAQNEKPNP